MTVAALVALALSSPSFAAPVSVTVHDRGVKTDCAEQDNVYAAMTAPGVRRFLVEARQPAYGAAIGRDVDAANFRHCAVSSARDYRFRRRRMVFYDDGKVMVRGIGYDRYWRPDTPWVEVAGRRDKGFHLVQVLVKDRGEWQESLVLHAVDGYWRLRPLPLPQLKSAVYGSSFLVGPVEEADGRPLVRIRTIRVDPKAMTLEAEFVRGGRAMARIVRLDRRALRLEVRLDPPVAGGPFLALRSMYVAPDNADTAEFRWTDGKGPHTAPPVGFGKVQAQGFSFARSVPSRHNTSAPDLLFSDFAD